MILSQFVAECQDLLDDPGAQRYPIATIIRNGDRSLRGLFRTMVQANKEYSNFTLCVQKEVAVELLDNVFQYRLPTWILHVVDVYVRDGTGTAETSFSPYRWTGGANVRFGEKIPKYSSTEYPHWTWEGNHTLRLWNFTSAQELVLSVAVRPAKMLKGKLTTTPNAQNALWLPPAPSFGEVELEEGAYINAEFQVTTTAVTNAATYGDVRRCIYSNAADTSTGSRLHLCVFDANWTATLAVDDQIESVLSIPDEHTRLLVLKTAQACFQKKNNSSGLKAIAMEMMEEERKFQAFATTPRDRQGPTYLKRGLRPQPPYNPDRPRFWPWS